MGGFSFLNDLIVFLIHLCNASFNYRIDTTTGDKQSSGREDWASGQWVGMWVEEDYLC